ncbi:MAG: acyltransferase family protein [Pirellulaceae bacterium]
MARIQYRPEIDGLRGVAVLAVILFHLDMGLSGGFVGVDVFFVISGFLITSIIMADLEAGTFSLKAFWIKRLRRLAPANFVMLSVTLLLGLVVLLPGELVSLVKAQLAQVVFFANFHFAFRIDYFDPIAALNPLLHTWSLAVEEHFYLVLPLLLLLCFKQGKRVVLATVVGLMVLSFLFSLWRVEQNQALAFYLLPSRAWELLLGCGLAFLPAASKRTSSKQELFQIVIAASSLVALGYGIFCYDETTLFPGANALLPCMATVGLIYGTQRDNFVRRLLSLPWLVGIGLISYSLYLWHWPIVVFTKLAFRSEPSPLLSLVLVILCFVPAYLSWKYIEQPFRKRRWCSSDKKFLLSGLALGTFFVISSLLIIRMYGLPERFDARFYDVVHATVSDRFQRSSAETIQERGLPIVGAADRTTRFVVWGDSHAAAISELVNDLAKEVGVSGYIASRSATIPLLKEGSGGRSDQQVWNEAVYDFIKQKQIKNVIFVARWSAYINRQAGRLECYSRAEFEDAVRLTLQRLESEGIHVWILPQVPEQKIDISRAILIADRTNRPVPYGISLEQYQKNQTGVYNAFYQDSLSGLTVLDLTPSCFRDGQSLIGQIDGKYYTDGDHLSFLGSQVLIKPVLKPLFEQLIKKPGSDAQDSLPGM